MVALRFDAEQRFSCRQCGRCCRRGWDIVVSSGELAAYRRTRAARWFREREEGPEGAARDPFEPLPGPRELSRIRKRPDGSCGFLSPQGQCRIHEELGAEHKPLACRLFPFRFHPTPGPSLVTASFSCPTVVANLGEPVEAQSKELEGLARSWSREHPEPSAGYFEYVAGRRLSRTSLDALRRILRTMLERPSADGRPDLCANAARMATLLEDLARHRVVRLADDAFAEYLELTGGYAAGTEKPVAPRRPSPLARLLSRGFLFVVEAARVQLAPGRASGLRLGLRLRLLALLAHCHGLWPPVAGLDLRAARRARVELAEPPAHTLVYHYLRAQIETLGSGRRPVLDELALAFAQLQSGLTLAAARAGRAGRSVADCEDLSHGLSEAADLAHASSGGLLGALLTTLAGGVEALRLFAWRAAPAGSPPR